MIRSLTTILAVLNLAPGAAARAGFASAELRATTPKLITVDITGYGEDGPYREMKAYDLLVQCESGLASVTGAPEQPGRVGVSVSDIACGMYAHAAVLEALLERQQTGRGKGLAVSLFDAMADWMTVPLLHYDYGGKAPGRAGLHHPSIAPYGGYTTRENEIVIVAIQNEREWARFCEQVLQDATLAADPRFDNNNHRVAYRPELDDIISGVFGDLDREQAVARLKGADIAYGAVNSIADLSAHPALKRRSAVSSRGETVEFPARPIDTSLRKTGDLPVVSAVGEHTEAIRREFA